MEKFPYSVYKCISLTHNYLSLVGISDVENSLFYDPGGWKLLRTTRQLAAPRTPTALKENLRHCLSVRRQFLSRGRAPSVTIYPPFRHTTPVDLGRYKYAERTPYTSSNGVTSYLCCSGINTDDRIPRETEKVVE